ncbi:unnamed protein product [Candidula unifasciata]|uniref:Uncharacterized protein n=1 Tax=Candidula unifasciata TaxID=100452 RepID=A0A8S3ZPF3_9EUPU|nr:unnamed protein product [Candidula unifasciata]
MASFGIRMCMALQHRERRRVIVILFTASMLCFIYLATINVIISDSEINLHLNGKDELHLKSVWTYKQDDVNHVKDADSRMAQPVFNSQTTNPTQFLLDQQPDDVSEEGESSSRHVWKKDQTRPNSKAIYNSTAFTRKLITTMTFNNTLVVDCKESPYIECVPPNLKPTPGKVFKITYDPGGSLNLNWISQAVRSINARFARRR